MRLVSQERTLGGVERIYVDDEGNVRDELIADVEPNIDFNKAAKNGDKPRSLLAGGEFKGELIASIPDIIAEKWLREYGVDVMNKEHWPRVAALLNDREWMYLKTTWETL